MVYIDIQRPVGFEFGFQSSVDFNSYKYCYKYEYGRNGKRCLVVGNDKDVFLSWFNGLEQDKRRFYEFIRENDIVAEYYDIDYHVSQMLTPEQQIEYSHSIIEQLLRVRNDVSDQTISKRDLVVLSAHTSSKISLHIITQTTYFENNSLQSLFMKDIYNKLNELGSEFNIDLSVYSKNRCFRMYKNTKYGQKNPLQLFAPEVYNFASMENTWVVLTNRDISKRVKIHSYDRNDLVVLQHHDETEEITSDLNELLIEFIQKHPYLSLEKVNTCKSINRINRIDNTTRECLTDPTDSHSKENMYWYIKNNQIFVHCFCGKGKPICLGMRKGIHQVDIHPESFKYGTHTSDDFKTYADFGPEVKTIFDKRATGKGKTTSAMQHAKSFNRVLLVDHRISLDADYITKYPEFTSYQTKANADKQTVCFNSLGKIDTDRYDITIIDEIRSTLRQTDMPDMALSTHQFFNILEDTDKPLIMLDANLTDEDIEYIMKIRKDPRFVVIHDPPVEGTKNVFVVCGKDEDAELNLLKKIDTYIRNNRKVVIPYNISIERINSLLSAHKDKRILHINKHTIKQVNMDTTTWYDEYDIIAYSPTISEGVSITDPRFKDVVAFGLFTSVSCPAESVSQMIARFRPIHTIYIFLDDRRTKPIPIFKRPMEVLAFLNSNMNNLGRLSKCHLNVARNSGVLSVINDEYCNLYCKIQTDLSKDYHNYRKTLYQKLVNNGYVLFEDFTDSITTVEKQELSETIKELKQQEHSRMNQCILNAPLLSLEEYKQLRDNGVECEEDECKMMKYSITKSINIQSQYMTEEIVDIFRESNVRSTIRHISNMFAFHRDDKGDLQRIDPSVLIQEKALEQFRDIETKTDFLSQKKNVTNTTTGKYNWLNRRAKDLGFQYLLSPDPVDLDTYTQGVERVLEYYRKPENYKKYVETQLLFGSHFSVEKQMNIDATFITSKFKTVMSITFGKDQSSEKVYQQINLPVVLYDRARQRPSILGDIILPPYIVKRYDIMFLKGFKGKYCEVCNCTLSSYISFTHLNSKEHIENLNK